MPDIGRLRFRDVQFLERVAPAEYAGLREWYAAQPPGPDVENEVHSRYRELLREWLLSHPDRTAEQRAASDALKRRHARIPGGLTNGAPLGIDFDGPVPFVDFAELRDWLRDELRRQSQTRNALTGRPRPVAARIAAIDDATNDGICWLDEMTGWTWISVLRSKTFKVARARLADLIAVTDRLANGGPLQSDLDEWNRRHRYRDNASLGNDDE